MGIQLTYVDKLSQGDWLPATFFSDFNVRVILKEDTYLIKEMNDVKNLTKYFNRDVGVEGTDWICDLNPYTEHYEFYTISSGPFIVWRLQEKTNILDMVGAIQEHTMDPNLLNLTQMVVEDEETTDVKEDEEGA